MIKGVVFVFGSNLAGRHGKGAALDARRHYGAKYGVGTGHVGNSYAIPTKCYNLTVLPLSFIKTHVDSFIDYATKHPELLFYTTSFGTGYAGYSLENIKSLFPDKADIPYNILFTKDWL